MISKLNLSVQDYEVYDTLANFGFSDQAIANAFTGNKKKNLETLLDWLVKNEESQNCKASFSEPLVEPPKVDEKQLQKSDSVIINKSLAAMKGPCPFVAELSHDVVHRIKAIINELSTCVSKNPHEIITFANEVLKNLKFSGQAFNREVIQLCGNERNFTQHSVLQKMRSAFYHLLERAFNKKVKKSASVDIGAYEYALLLIAEMKIFSDQQLELTKTTYIKFCKKMSINENELLLKQIEVGLPNSFNAANATNERRKSSNFSDTDSNDSRDSKDFDPPKSAMTSSKSKFLKETVGNSSNEKVVDKEEKKENGFKSVTPSSCDKESCLICMERMREIVFMPCCHFLTCPLCTPKLTNCPICNKKIEKNLKIFWC